jgi:hypothetical protein
MKKPNKKQQPSVKKYKDSIQRYSKIAFNHRTFIVFVIIGGAITFALLRTRNFIDIPRNETTYNEARLQINYKSIDEELLSSFSQAESDQSVEVDSQFNPNRADPFSE